MNTYPIRFLLALGTALSVTYGQSAPVTAVAPEAIVRATHQRNDFDGVVVVTRHGKVISSTAVGLSNKAERTPMRPETVFRLASLTKQVTSLLVMQQVVAGRLRLDGAAGDAWPALPASIARVTIKQLLQHVSGLPNPSDGPENLVPPFYLRTGTDAANMTKSALGFCAGTPTRDPGAKFEYNNCDYIVLGGILEHLAGKPYAQLVRENVITPLGLASWGVFGADPSPVTAIGYQPDGSPELPQNPATYGSAGGLYGNALDVAKWDDALLHNNLLPADATAIMFRAEPKLYGEALGSWSYDVPGIKPTLHVIERQGDIGSTLLLNLLIPALDESVVILSNNERADLFNTYSQKGLGHALLQSIAASR